MSKQALRNASESQQFSKEIVTEDFYVLHAEGEDLIEFETTTAPTAKVSIIEPEKFSRAEPNAEEVGFDFTEEQEDETPKKKSEDVEELDTDFFEKGVDDDAEKKIVIEEIAGMTETETAATAEVAQEAQVKVEVVEVKSDIIVTDSKEVGPKIPRSKRASTIQFKQHQADSEKVDTGSEKSVESDKEIAIRPSLSGKVSSKKSSTSRTRRPSGLPELMKLSKKSLLALTSSLDGSGLTRKSMGEERFSVLKKDGIEMFALPEFAKASLRSNYYTELGPRYRQADDDDLENFDFGGDAPIFFEVVQEEEDEVSIQEEEETFKLERAPFYERHDKAAQEVAIRKMKNFLLHKKLAMYFKRKKMDYATKETEWSFDSQNKYFKKLESYGDLRDFIEYERVRITQDLDETKQLRADKFKKLTNMFKKMQDREGEIGFGLINTKTGNALPDKFVERLLRRQSTQMTQVSSMRLTYIRLKGMVQEKLDAIASLNQIAPGFLLADYEQLKSDNRAYSDKIEEKDEELTRLRSKCGNTIQVLAHLREKTSALESDLEDLIEERQNLDFGYFVVRSQLNEQKQSRDTVRHALNKLRNESGLLTQPTLLKDMEQGLIEVKRLTDQLNQIRKEHKKRASQITTIRRKMEQCTDLRRNSSKKSLTHFHSTAIRSTSIKRDRSVKVYRGRPSLMIPVIEDSAFHSLKAIKPKLTYNRSQGIRSNMEHNKRTGG